MLFIYIVNQQMHVYKYIQSHFIILLQHVSATHVTIIRVSIINIQIIVQKHIKIMGNINRFYRKFITII